MSYLIFLLQAKMMYSDGGKMITKPIGDTSATKVGSELTSDHQVELILCFIECKVEFGLVKQSNV